MKEIWVKREEVRVGDRILDARDARGQLYTGDVHQGTMSGGTCVVSKLGSEGGFFFEARGGERFKNDGFHDKFVDFLVEREEITVLSAKRIGDLEKEMAKSILEELTKPPPPRTFDGITSNQCFERYLDNMREAVHPDGTPRRWKLTPAQKREAQMLWTNRVNAKQVEQAARDQANAVSVVVECDDE